MVTLERYRCGVLLCQTKSLQQHMEILTTKAERVQPRGNNA